MQGGCAIKPPCASDDVYDLRFLRNYDFQKISQLKLLVLNIGYTEINLFMNFVKLGKFG